MRFIKNPINLEKRQKEKEEKAFKDDIKYFLSKESFTLHDFHDRVKQGLKGTSSFFSYVIKILHKTNYFVKL